MVFQQMFDIVYAEKAEIFFRFQERFSLRNASFQLRRHRNVDVFIIGRMIAT